MTGLDCVLLRVYLLFMSEQMYNVCVYLYTYVCTCVRVDRVGPVQQPTLGPFYSTGC